MLQQLAPKSACRTEATVMTMLPWRASSLISNLKDSNPMISEVWKRHKGRIEDYIEFYNFRRPQRKLNKLTPVEYRRQLAA
ncbi:IS3 family transposase [Paenibacillus sp. MY03]|uniref:IS3 family transposase n=1 Tax=Paenibacillus sp. MY03 TaxID=302980 RepID=UPI00356B685F